MNGLVDILEDEEKSKSLLTAWNGFKIEVFYQIQNSAILWLTKLPAPT
jgi:hypothetical protein